MGLCKPKAPATPPSTEVRKVKRGDSHGEGDRVLRADDFPETVERVLAAATRKDHRVLYAGKEIRLNNEVHGSQVASETSSPLVQELGRRFSLRVRSVAL